MPYVYILYNTYYICGVLITRIRTVGKSGNRGGAHCTEIDFALSFGAVVVKMIDLSKTESKDFFGIILGQENSQKLYLLPKSC